MKGNDFKRFKYIIYRFIYFISKIHNMDMHYDLLNSLHKEGLAFNKD